MITLSKTNNREVSLSDHDTTESIHYLPHLPVKDSVTTPIRTAYDCSCRANGNLTNLNDCPTVTPQTIYVQYYYAFAAIPLPFQWTLKKLSFKFSYTQVIEISQDLFGHQAQIQQQTFSHIALLLFSLDHQVHHLCLLQYLIYTSVKIYFTRCT